jgi:hypothetical protein
MFIMYEYEGAKVGIFQTQTADCQKKLSVLSKMPLLGKHCDLFNADSIFELPFDFDCY